MSLIIFYNDLTSYMLDGSLSEARHHLLFKKSYMIVICININHFYKNDIHRIHALEELQILYIGKVCHFF